MISWNHSSSMSTNSQSFWADAISTNELRHQTYICVVFYRQQHCFQVSNRQRLLHPFHARWDATWDSLQTTRHSVVCCTTQTRRHTHVHILMMLIIEYVLLYIARQDQLLMQRRNSCQRRWKCMVLHQTIEHSSQLRIMPLPVLGFRHSWKCFL